MSLRVTCKTMRKPAVAGVLLISLVCTLSGHVDRLVRFCGFDVLINNQILTPCFDHNGLHDNPFFFKSLMQ